MTLPYLALHRHPFSGFTVRDLHEVVEFLQALYLKDLQTQRFVEKTCFCYDFNSPFCMKMFGGPFVYVYIYINIYRFFSKRIQSYIYITQSWKTSSVSLKKRDLLIFLHPQKQKTPGQLGKVHWPTSPKDSKATLAASTSMLFGKGWRPVPKSRPWPPPRWWEEM